MKKELQDSREFLRPMKFYLFIIISIIITFSIFPQENKDQNDDPSFTPTPVNPELKIEKEKEKRKNPHTAALLGIVPGVGQAYLGNYGTASTQLITFMGIYNLERYYRHQPDYINYQNRDVKFDPGDALIGYEFQKYGLVYNNMPYKEFFQYNDQYQKLGYPVFSETNYDRALRLWQERKIAEENTLVKYGSYSRTNRNTTYADMLNNPVLSTMFYSVYSSYRDAGGAGEERKSETLGELALSPFNPQVLMKPEVLAPIVLFLGIGAAQWNQADPILVPASLKRDGTLPLQTFVDGISPGVGEEAFFRGYLNRSLVGSMGPYGGIGTSSLMFMLAHEGNPDAKEGRLSRLLAGAYFGWVHYYNKFDIKPGIALHFWNNLLIGLAMLHNYKADQNYDKSQREVFYMPISFTFTM